MVISPSAIVSTVVLQYSFLISSVTCTDQKVTMSEYVPVDLAYICYEPDGGANDSLPPIIFLHGVTASKEMWSDVPQRIADKTKRKAYTVDSRNHGDTEWTDEFNFDMNADDLLHFMDTIGAPKAVLLGHSMGGITAIKTALKSPNRIEIAFVEDMFVKRLSQEILDMVVTYSSLFREAVRLLPPDCPEEDVVKEVMKFIIEKVPEISQNLSNPDAMANFKFPLKKDENGRYVMKANLDVIEKALKNGDTIMSDPSGLYEGPAYFIYGCLSPFKVNEDKENIKKYFPNAELIGVEKADHSIHIQYPEKFSNIVAEKILKH